MNDQVFAGLIFVAILVFWLLPKLSKLGQTTEHMENIDQSTENKYLRLMVKYLTLLLRRRDAEKELYRLAQGHSQVYHSPRIDVLDKQIYEIKKMVQKDPKTLDFFKLNLDLTMI